MDSGRLRVAVITQSKMTSGGGFQYELSLIRILGKLDRDKYQFIYFTSNKEVQNRLVSEGYQNVFLLKSNFVDKLIRLYQRQSFSYFLAQKFRILSMFEKELKRYAVDLVYFLGPSGIALDLLEHSYIITVWDLCHLDNPEFPEVSYYREFERREYFYSKSLSKAFAVITDNEVTKKKIATKYGVNDKRIHILPFVVSNQILQKVNHEINVRSKYSLQREYIFYPAQFWPHKNHIYILEALNILKREGIKIDSVFVGSDKGNLDFVRKKIKEYDLEDQVKILGFIPEEDIYSLYKNSIALVMPTYFGPTNIPPLEAFYVGVPVIYSDIEDFRVQVKDAVLFCDLKDPGSLANHIKNLRNDPTLREDLVLKGKNILSSIREDDILTVLEKIFQDYIERKKCWK